METDQFVPKSTYSTLKSGKITYQSPSNIALVKYWGKHGQQQPKNTSLSFTLSQCNTQTQLFYEPKNTAADYDFEVLLDGKTKADFKPKITQFFNRIEPFLPFLKQYRFTIKTTNSFPHSSGIASSASGMSALALCLMEMERKMLGKDALKNTNKKASFIARLGSGSACRSLEGPLVSWGKHPDLSGSSDYFGTVYRGNVAKVFKNYRDTILLVETGSKKVSSTLGHQLMNGHPYAQQRFEQANANISKLTEILKTGDLDAFIQLVELEALSLHAMMMTSSPYFILIKEHTLSIINAIWEYRKSTEVPLCFTLDAGANVHLLYPETYKEKVQQFIADSLAKFCKDERYIHDSVGSGAFALEN